jgi:hypothetical protein
MNTYDTPNHTAELDEQMRRAEDTLTEKLVDLPALGEQEAKIKGGLPAIQKVREAAAR